MRMVGRCAITVAALVGLGLFTALIGADTYVPRSGEAAPTGKFSIQFVVGFALVLGWAVGAGVEGVWRDQTEHSEWWEGSVFAALPRLVGGVFLYLVVVGLSLGFEALGVGLGAD